MSIYELEVISNAAKKYLTSLRLEQPHENPLTNKYRGEEIEKTKAAINSADKELFKARRKLNLKEKRRGEAA